MPPPDLTAMKLGVDAGEMAVDDQTQVLEAVRAIVDGTRREIALVSRHLDRRVFEDDAIVEAFKRVATRGRGARIRLFVLDPEPVVRNGHRLVDLAQRVSSHMQIRIPGRAHRRFNESWLLADTYGYMRLRFADRYEGSVDFNDRRTVRDLTERFDEMWEAGREDPNLRRLAL